MALAVLIFSEGFARNYQSYMVICFENWSDLAQIHSKSLYKSRVGKHLYGTENEIWAGLGPVGNTEKKIGGQLWATFESLFLMFSGAKQKFDLKKEIR